MVYLWKISILLVIQHSITITEKVLAQNVSPSVEAVFLENEIVPDVIPYAPECKLSVVYQSGVQVDLGNELTPIQALSAPSVSYPRKVNPGDYYTLALVDPDVPSRALPLLRNFNHWLVGNIPGDQVASGEPLAVYLGPTPPPATGLHRYVFLFYKQPDRIDFDELLNISSNIIRTRFSIADFAKKYNLGNPVAGNFFVSQSAINVPILSK